MLKKISIIITIVLISLFSFILIKKIFFSNFKTQSCISYSIPIVNISTEKKIAPGMYIAGDRECLEQIENTHNINLSKKLNHLEEYKKYTFAYFVQFHDYNSIGNTMDATDFHLYKYQAYFEFSYPDIAMIDEQGNVISNDQKTNTSGTRISIAAVPKDSIDYKYNIFSEKYRDDNKNKWEIIYTD